jgi:hypothetical protein
MSLPPVPHLDGLSVRRLFSLDCRCCVHHLRLLLRQVVKASTSERNSHTENHSQRADLIGQVD